MKPIVFVFSDVALTLAMQKWGIFDECKVIIKQPLQSTVKDSWGHVDFDHVQKGFVTEDRYKLIGCTTDGFRWSDPEVSQVSDGSKVFLLADYLAHIQALFDLAGSPTL